MCRYIRVFFTARRTYPSFPTSLVIARAHFMFECANGAGVKVEDPSSRGKGDQVFLKTTLRGFSSILIYRIIWKILLFYRKQIHTHIQEILEDPSWQKEIKALISSFPHIKRSIFVQKCPRGSLRGSFLTEWWKSRIVHVERGRGSSDWVTGIRGSSGINLCRILKSFHLYCNAFKFL